MSAMPPAESPHPPSIRDRALALRDWALKFLEEAPQVRARALQAGTRRADQVRAWAKRRPRSALGLAAAPVVAAFAAVSVIWISSGRYVDLIETRLADGVFDAPTQIWSGGETLSVGDRLSARELAARWRLTAQARDRPQGPVVSDAGIELPPDLDEKESVAVEFREDRVRRIRRGDKRVNSTRLAPAFLTYLADDERTLRRPVAYRAIPENLIRAVIAVEDHRFFDHNGMDLVRTTRAALGGLVEMRRPSGTSTLTQQLARGLFLTPQRTYSRKLAEFLIAIRLERQLTKEQILEHYLNQIYMGRFGGYNIAGMSAAAAAYFDKRIGDLALHEAALLAGLLQRPSYLNPRRYPDRAVARRNVVLQAMLKHGYIDEEQCLRASSMPVDVVPGDIDDKMAPYFVELVRDDLRATLSGPTAGKGLLVETTLDMRLQRAALAAVESGMANVDDQVAKQRRFKGKQPPRAQVALIALDPQTGAVKALIGGRDYDHSQLNRVRAERQPGSTFKPFVYAAALSSTARDREVPGSADGSDAMAFTAATPLLDWPADFAFKDEIYRPSNYGHVVRGYVTLRDALVHSLNIPTVKLASAVGYRKVAALARKAGFSHVGATPSAALGAYETSPLELAAAYTVFANQGRRAHPYFIESVRDGDATVFEARPQTTDVLDPRVAYITTDILTDVINRGTGADVRRLGYRGIAAGKTGTDDDGWFVGFTPKLLCLVWVGFDDNTDLGLTGADSALPVWTAFMKEAEGYADYQAAEGFERPEDLDEKFVDPGRLTPDKPETYSEESLAEFVESVNQIDAEGDVEVEPLFARFKPLELRARKELFLPGTAPKARFRFSFSDLFAKLAK